MGWSALAPQVRWTLAGIFGLLVAASAIVALLRRWKPDRDFGELGQRVKTWWVMVAIFALAMVLSRTVPWSSSRSSASWP